MTDPTPTPQDRDARRTVAILEDMTAVRQEFERLVEAEPGLTLVASHPDLAEAEALFETPPDILLSDLVLPAGTSFELIARLRRETATRVIVISVLGDEQAVVTAIAAGAHSYLLKGATGFELRDAIFQVLEGHLPISPSIARYVIRQFRDTPSIPIENPDRPSLSPREREVLECLATGMTDKETARALDISPYTVADHIRAAFRKLDVSTRAAAVARAMSRGEISP